MYADDKHVNKSCNVNDMDSAILYVEKCVSNIKTSMLSNKLQMNEDNTEVLWGQRWSPVRTTLKSCEDNTEVLFVTPNELLNL